MEDCPGDGRVPVNSEAGTEAISEGKGTRGREEVKDAIDHSPTTTS